MENIKEGELTNSAEEFLLNLPKSTVEYSFGHQRTHKGWLVFAIDKTGAITALTFVPD
jgi:hypothetical protein